jgi:hypothetical protein
MKRNSFFVPGLLALVLAFGLAFSGCDTGNGGEIKNGNPFVGTWRADTTGVEITLNADLTGSYIGQSLTYTYSGDNVTITISGTPAVSGSLANGKLSWGYTLWTKQ